MNRPQNLRALLAGISLVAAVTLPSSAIAQSVLNPDHAAAVGCIYNVLRSDRRVESIGVYRVDGRRSAVEFAFHDENYGMVVTDIMLHGKIKGDVAYDLGVAYGKPDAELEDKGFRSADFVGHLQIAQKCSLMPAFDNVFPRPKRRSEWQQVDWPIPGPSSTPNA